MRLKAFLQAMGVCVCVCSKGSGTLFGTLQNPQERSFWHLSTAKTRRAQPVHTYSSTPLPAHILPVGAPLGSCGLFPDRDLRALPSNVKSPHRQPRPHPLSGGGQRVAGSTTTPNVKCPEKLHPADQLPLLEQRAPCPSRPESVPFAFFTAHLLSKSP